MIRCQILVTYQQKHFDADGFKCADLLRPASWILDSQLEGRLSVEHHDVALGK